MMGTAAQGLIGIALLLTTGDCISKTPTGQELFDAEQMGAVIRTHAPAPATPIETAIQPDRFALTSLQFWVPCQCSRGHVL